MSAKKYTDIWIGLAILSVCLFLYLVNGDFIPSNDSTSHVYGPVSILRDGDLTFTPQAEPFMFEWEWTAPGASEAVPVSVDYWDQLAPNGASWFELQQRGELALAGAKYYLAATDDPETKGYVSSYGPGPGLIAVPILAVGSLFVDDYALNRALHWYSGKMAASCCAALSVMIVYLTARRLATRSLSVVVALAFGLGTSVWSGASQSLDQTAPCLFFVTLAVFCAIRAGDRSWGIAACGATTAAAVICRQTAALLVIAIGIDLAIEGIWRWKREGIAPAPAFRRLGWFVLGGLPLAIMLGAYNQYCFGAPWHLAQSATSLFFASAKLDSNEIWSTPFIVGFLGLTLSPSRGMFVYSPFLVFAVWGSLRSWKYASFHWMRPCTIAMLLLVAMYSKYFDWHGGWCFGYRYMIEALPLVILGIIVIAGPITRSRVWTGIFVAALCWSITVQFIGAFAYNLVGWNNREAWVVKLPPAEKHELVIDPTVADQRRRQPGAQVTPIRMNVDAKIHRRRLGSVQDSQLVYYVARFGESRRVKKALIHHVLNPPVQSD